MAAGGLHVRDLVVERGGREVLHGVSLELHPGELTALLGANGAGKSTLVATMAGVLPALSGAVTLNGVDMLGKPPEIVRRHGIAMVMEGHPVLNGISVIDNLRAAGLMHPRAETEREIEATLALFPELGQRLEVGAQFLSGGQKQMVVIAQALISKPRYLLIDELSFGLAPAIVVRLGETVKAVAERGIGILLIEQFTTLALELASRAHVMERGELVFSGAAAELQAHPEILHGAYLASGKAAAAIKQAMK
jgi:branched-chain amino acid transport system ATP-binding protein